jgi:alpha-ribazole phosphatase
MASVLAPLVRVDGRLAELDFGRWEGRLWKDIPRIEIDAWAEDPVRRSPPGGENFESLQLRALAALGEACRLAADRMPILCTHAGVIRALLAKARGLSLADSLALEVPFGSVHALEWKESVSP